MCAASDDWCSWYDTSNAAYCLEIITMVITGILGIAMLLSIFLKKVRKIFWIPAKLGNILAFVIQLVVVIMIPVKFNSLTFLGAKLDYFAGDSDDDSYKKRMQLWVDALLSGVFAIGCFVMWFMLKPSKSKK